MKLITQSGKGQDVTKSNAKTQIPTEQTTRAKQQHEDATKNSMNITANKLRAKQQHEDATKNSMNITANKLRAKQQHKDATKNSMNITANKLNEGRAVVEYGQTSWLDLKLKWSVIYN